MEWNVWIIIQNRQFLFGVTGGYRVIAREVPESRPTVFVVRLSHCLLARSSCMQVASQSPDSVAAKAVSAPIGPTMWLTGFHSLLRSSVVLGEAIMERGGPLSCFVMITYCNCNGKHQCWDQTITSTLSPGSTTVPGTHLTALAGSGDGQASFKTLGRRLAREQRWARCGHWGDLPAVPGGSRVAFSLVECSMCRPQLKAKSCLARAACQSQRITTTTTTFLLALASAYPHPPQLCIFYLDRPPLPGFRYPIPTTTATIRSIADRCSRL